MFEPDEMMLIDPFGADPAGSVTPAADGSIVVDFDADEGTPWEPPEDVGEFGENLVGQIKPTELAVLADEVVGWADADETAREPWLRRFEAGLKASGLVTDGEVQDTDDIIDAAMRITHPLLIEACVQFQSRAIQEMFPPSGPVKGDVAGHVTKALREQADRVADYLNYQMIHEDRTYFWDVDQMLLLLPLVGSAFKKSYYDPEWKTVRSVLCRATDILIPYTVTNLYDAARITHRFRMRHAKLQALQAAGYYADVNIPMPSGAGDVSSAQALIDKVDDRQSSLADGDDEHTLLECHCEYEFPSLGDDGVRPYIVTVDADTQQVLGVRRNWKPDDESRRARLRFTQYKYLPGLGAYGFGLFHAIGGLGEAATGLVRMILIGGAFNAMPGGFKSRTAKMAGSVSIKPGVFTDVDMTYEELQKAFWSPQFRDPGQALPALLGLLTEAGQRFSSTTEAMVGDANNTGPVGTTLALIEQGSKVYSAIHKRLHYSAGEEFRIRFELNAEHLPEQYPYAIGGQSRSIMRADFSDDVSVSPVSDPNIFSSAQRIAMAQGQLELARSAPAMYDLYEAHRRMLEAMRTPDIDDLLPDPNHVPHADPVSEGSYLLVGKPIRAHIDEAHDAHLAVHSAQLQQFQAMPPQIAGTALNALIAHMAEHLAQQYRMQMAQAMGLDLPALDLFARQRQEQGVDIGNSIALQAAWTIQQMEMAAQQQAMLQQAGPPGAMPADPRQQADAERFAARQAQQDAALQADIDRDRIRQAADYLTQAGVVDIDPQALVQTAQQLGAGFAEALAVLRHAQAQQQGLAPFDQTALALQ